MDRTDKLVLKPHNKGHRTAGYTGNAVRQRHTKASNCFFNHEYPPKIFVFPITSFPEYLNYWLLSTAGSSAQIFFTQSLRSFPKHSKNTVSSAYRNGLQLAASLFSRETAFSSALSGTPLHFSEKYRFGGFLYCGQKRQETKSPTPVHQARIRPPAD